jgi:3'-phosphoadenosine 5'-phosphosulfate sulfotransferase (PAPS reductase)/FAD synthetase
VLKIDVGAVVITNQPRFLRQHLLVVTGERAEESSRRAKYQTVERHRTDRRGTGLRTVTHWRPLHTWSEAEVWAILERWRVRPHWAYYLGFGRVSCALCVFASPNQWATIRHIMPERFARAASIERDLGHTIDSRFSVTQLADRGEIYAAALARPDLVALALRRDYDAPILLGPDEVWQLPAGAFGENAGPV